MQRHIPAAIACLALAAAASAQSTAFTYQGRLKNGPQAASGPHDVRFRLFDAPSGGAQIGATQCVDNVAVTDGLFTTPIDFGQQFAAPAPRFLEIEVRADTGLGCGTTTGFVVLTPRQPVTPAPVATHAHAAYALDAADGSPTNAVFVSNDGRVGIGTTNPAGLLDIQGVNNSNVLFGRRTGGGLTHNLYIDSAGNGSMQLRDGAGVVRTEIASGLNYFNYGNVGIGTTMPATSLHVNGQALWLTGGNGGGLPLSAGGGLRLYDDGVRGNIFAFNYATGTPRSLALQEPGGNVGIGTTTPLARLDVRGDVRVGSAGQFFATAGQENLRIIRGRIAGSGTMTSGAGFMCERKNVGWYSILYSTPFAGTPSVTATCVVGNPVTNEHRDANIYVEDAAGVTIIVKHTEGSYVDSNFSFIAVGLR